MTDHHTLAAAEPDHFYEPGDGGVAVLDMRAVSATTSAPPDNVIDEPTALEAIEAVPDIHAAEELHNKTFQAGFAAGIEQQSHSDAEQQPDADAAKDSFMVQFDIGDLRYIPTEFVAALAGLLILILLTSIFVGISNGFGVLIGVTGLFVLAFQYLEPDSEMGVYGYLLGIALFVIGVDFALGLGYLSMFRVAS